MMAGLVLGRVIKVGESPPTIKTVRMGGIHSKKEIAYAGFSGISGHYEVELESAEVDGKRALLKDPRSVVSLRPVARVDKFTGNYLLPFQWGTDQNVSGGDPVTIDMKSYYVPKDNGINRRRIMRGTLVKRFGEARWKTAYVADINEFGYPDIDVIADLRPHSHEFMRAVSDLAYHAPLPMWEDSRQRYSKMLCAVVDVRISEGGISS